jgi:hypothetical protein
MRIWERDGYKVIEQDLDFYLRQFAVVVEGKKVQIISPRNIESMLSIIDALNAGADVNGWEDGKGSIIHV